MQNLLRFVDNRDQFSVTAFANRISVIDDALSCRKTTVDERKLVTLRSAGMLLHHSNVPPPRLEASHFQDPGDKPGRHAALLSCNVEVCFSWR